MGETANAHLVYGLYLGNEGDYPLEEWQEQLFGRLESFDDHDDFIFSVMEPDTPLESVCYGDKREVVVKAPFEIACLGYYNYPLWVICPKGADTHNLDWSPDPIDLQAILDREAEYAETASTIVELLGLNLPDSTGFKWFLGADLG